MAVLLYGAAHLAVAVVAAALSLAASWAATRPLRGTGQAPARFHRRGTAAGLFVAAVVIVPVVVLVDAVTWGGSALVRLAGGGDRFAFIGLVADFVVLGYPAFLAAGAGWMASYRGTDIRGRDQFGKLAVGYSVPWLAIGVAVLGIPALLATGGTAVAALLPPVLVAVTMGVYPRLVRRTQEVRAPDADERAVFAAGVELVGIDPADQLVEVIETDPDDDRAGLFVLGLRGWRTVFVRDTFFEAFEPAHQRVLAALLGAGARSPRRDVRALVAGILLGALVLILVAVESLLLLVVLPFVGLVMPAAWLITSIVARRWTYRTDDRVAQAVGADTVADALEALAARSESDDSMVARLLFMVPSVDRRVERLRERAE